jgi:glycosyltransferase involved in cell wall biosynthesis
MRGVSVIICCYNSAYRIRNTLEHLNEQVIENDLEWEILLIDNASSDNTASVAKEIWRDLNAKASFRVMREERSGLSYARERGILESHYDFLLFCDDDNWLEKDFVMTAFNIMNSDGSIGALGGLGIPKWEVSPSRWNLDLQGCYATGPQFHQDGEVSTSHVYGAACTFRKAAIKILVHKSFISILTGRKGKMLTAGEDHELCYALRLLGYSIHYSKNLVFYHFIPKERMSKAYLSRLLDGFMISSHTLFLYKSLIEKKPEYKMTFVWLFIIKLKVLFSLFVKFDNNTKLAARDVSLLLRSYSLFNRNLSRFNRQKEIFTQQ